jgi:hypothetical protein
MKTNRLALGLFVLAGIVVGCGGAHKGPAKYQKGPMPPDGVFDGVYQSDFGRLELTAEANGQVTGLYEADQHNGRIEGTIEDNLLFFSWTQWNQEMRGKIRETNGEGVFEYFIEEVQTTSQTKNYHQLKGWWGYSEGEMNNPWNASKLSNRSKKRLKPFNPTADGEGTEEYNASVGFDGSNEEESSSGGGGFDESAEEAEEDDDDGDSLDDLF